MKYKENKLRLNEMQRCRVFTFWLNLVWFLFIHWRFIVKNPLRFYWEKICSIHYLHFSFEKHVPSQVLNNFSVDNLETTPRSFHSKFCSKIYLSQIINYWGSIFILYLTWGPLLNSYFFFFLSVFFFSCFIGIFLDKH